MKAVALRTVCRLLWLALLLLPFSCRDSETPEGGSCQAVAWGGWDGTPECAGIASVVIAPEARVCQTDTDCTLVGVTQCTAHSANHFGAGSLSQQPAPCKVPIAGNFCVPVRYAPRCMQGCCVPQRM